MSLGVTGTTSAFPTPTFNGLHERQLGILKLEAPSAVASVRRALESEIYGAHVAHYLQELSEGAVAKQFKLETRVAALTCISEAACVAHDEYFRNRPHLASPGDERSKFLSALRPFQQTAAEGKIVLLDESYAMTEGEGELFAHKANQLLGGHNEEVEQVLAMINYARFTSSTMKSGADILQELGDVQGLLGWNAAGDFARMPHLTISNFGLAAVVSGVIASPHRVGNDVLVQDLGSGTGATLAATFLGAAELLKVAANPPRARVALYGSEPNPAFFLKLTGEFGTALTPLQSRLGLGSGVSIVGPQLTADTIIKRATSAELRATAAGAHLTVVTANYVLHRIPDTHKQRAVTGLAQLPGDVVVAVGDLVRNASVINRRYFNFRDNGLLNPGNISLTRILTASGFKTATVSPNFRPNTMSVELAERLSTGVIADGMFLVAYKGDTAERIVESWKQPAV